MGGLVRINICKVLWNPQVQLYSLIRITYAFFWMVSLLKVFPNLSDSMIIALSFAPWTLGRGPRRCTAAPALWPLKRSTRWSCWLLSAPLEWSSRRRPSLEDLTPPTPLFSPFSRGLAILRGGWWRCRAHAQSRVLVPKAWERVINQPTAPWRNYLIREMLWGEKRDWGISCWSDSSIILWAVLQFKWTHVWSALKKWILEQKYLGAWTLDPLKLCCSLLLSLQDPMRNTR